MTASRSPRLTAYPHGHTYYGGICCVECCHQRQLPGRVYCEQHLLQLRRGCAPFIDNLTTCQGQSRS